MLYLLVRSVWLVAVVHASGNALSGGALLVAPGGTVGEPALHLLLAVVALAAAVPLLLARRRAAPRSTGGRRARG